MFAYAPNGIVADLVEALPDYHPSLVEQYRKVPASAPPGLALGWQFNGTTYAPATEPVASDALPPEVTSAQAKIQLSRSGFLTAVKASVDAIGGEVEIWFTDARTWQRDNPHVKEIGAGLNLTSAEIDDLFREAAKIDA